jgi:N utilization substance protein B
MRVYFPVMLKKRKTRELAMQLLFLWDANGEPDTALADQCLRDSGAETDVCQSALKMATGAWEQRGLIEVRVERLAPQWPPRRQPGVDRNILRLAVWELTNADTPPKVVIDEAIELAKAFSTEQSPAFVNGVLDAVLKENVALKSEPEARSLEVEARSQESEAGSQESEDWSHKSE